MMMMMIGIPSQYIETMCKEGSRDKIKLEILEL